MVIENLTQRTDDFKEIVQNLKCVREYLKTNINRSESEQMKSKRKDGRGGKMDEKGSIRDIAGWLNKHGEVLSFGNISQILSVQDNSNPYGQYLD